MELLVYSVATIVPYLKASNSSTIVLPSVRHRLAHRMSWLASLVNSYHRSVLEASISSTQLLPPVPFVLTIKLVGLLA